MISEADQSTDDAYRTLLLLRNTIGPIPLDHLVPSGTDDAYNGIVRPGWDRSSVKGWDRSSVKGWDRSTVKG